MISIIRNLFGRENLPSWDWYSDMRQMMPKNDQPIDEVPFIVVDIEATGLNLAEDRILSIGAIPCRGNEIRTDLALDLSVAQDFFRPETIAIHGIIPKNSNRKELQEKEAVISFFKMVGHAVWVGHFADFDKSIIRKTAARYGLFEIHNPIVDTASLISRFDSYYKIPGELKAGEMTLSTICKKYNLPIEGEHTAIGDALTTAFLFLFLKGQLKKRGVMNWKALKKSCV